VNAILYSSYHDRPRTANALRYTYIITNPEKKSKPFLL